MNTYFWRRTAAVLAAAASLLVAGCNTPPAYSVSEQPAARVGTVESITTQTVQNVPNAVGAIGGALVGGGLGSLIGGGTGKTVATVVGAIGGGFVGNELASRDQTLVWNIGVRYDDGSLPRPADVGARTSHRRPRARHVDRDRAPSRIETDAKAIHHFQRGIGRRIGEEAHYANVLQATRGDRRDRRRGARIRRVGFGARRPAGARQQGRDDAVEFHARSGHDVAAAEHRPRQGRADRAGDRQGGLHHRRLGRPCACSSPSRAASGSAPRSTRSPPPASASRPASRRARW